MLPPTHPLAELLRDDPRYTYDAYVFVFEALNYAQSVLGLGKEAESESGAAPADEESDEPEHHVTGQELCEAIRRYALQQYGLMAKAVLGSWGITKTGDFGNIVFNLIRIGKMRKTPRDRREDFEDVYDFETAFRQDFRIGPD